MCLSAVSSLVHVICLWSLFLSRKTGFYLNWWSCFLLLCECWMFPTHVWQSGAQVLTDLMWTICDVTKLDSSQTACRWAVQQRMDCQLQTLSKIRLCDVTVLCHLFGDTVQISWGFSADLWIGLVSMLIPFMVILQTFWIIPGHTPMDQFAPC